MFLVALGELPLARKFPGVTTSDESPSGNRLGQFGLAFAILGILIGGGLLAVILVWIHVVFGGGFD
jgi:hypothetical protein